MQDGSRPSVDLQTLENTSSTHEQFPITLINSISKICTYKSSPAHIAANTWKLNYKFKLFWYWYKNSNLKTNSHDTHIIWIILTSNLKCSLHYQLYLSLWFTRIWQYRKFSSWNHHRIWHLEFADLEILPKLRVAPTALHHAHTPVNTHTAYARAMHARAHRHSPMNTLCRPYRSWEWHAVEKRILRQHVPLQSSPDGGRYCWCGVTCDAKY